MERPPQARPASARPDAAPEDTDAAASPGAHARSRHAASTAVVLAWLIACLPLWLHGFPHGHDASFELFRIAGFRNALADGQWLPYWGGDFFVGYGSPIYTFYAPAFMAVASLASHLAGSLLSASVWTATGCLALAAKSAQLAAHAAFARVAPALRHQLACLSACAFVLHPYLLGDLYLRNSLAELAALCLFPLTLWSLLLLRAEGPRAPTRAALWIGLVCAASVLTHNLSALVAMAFLWLTAAFLLIPARDDADPSLRAQRLGALAGGVALGLALAAYFWVPALGYNDLTRTGIELREGKLDFHGNFVPFFSNFGLAEFYGSGPLMPLALLGGFALSVLRPRRAAWLAALTWPLLVFSAFALLLQLRVSTPLWEHLPFLALMQFPWRLIGPLGLVGALCLGVLAAPLWGRVAVARWPWLQLAALCLLCSQAAFPLARAKPLPDAVQQGFDSSVTPDAIRNNPGAMATFRWEYIPREADRDLWKADRRYRGAVHHTRGPVALEIARDAPRHIELAVRVPASSDAAPPAASAVVFRRWAFPGWEAWLDDEPVPVHASPEGLVAVSAPPGHHRLRVALSPPPLRAVTTPVSLLALLVLALGFARLRRNRAG